MNLTVLLAVLVLAAWTYLASSRGGDSYQNPYVNEIRTALFRPVTAIERLVRPDGSAPPWWLCPALLVAAIVLAGSAAGILLGAGGGSFRAFGAVAGAIVSESLDLVAQLSVLRLLLDWRLSGSWGSAPLGFLECVTWPIPEIGTRGGLSGPSRQSRTAAQYAATAALFAAAEAVAAFSSGRAFSPAAVVVSAIGTLSVFRALLGFFCICSFLTLFVASPYGATRSSGLARLAGFLASASNDWLAEIRRATVGREMALGPVGIVPVLLYFAASLLERALFGLLF